MMCLAAVTMHIISIQLTSSYLMLLLMRFFAGLGAGATLAAWLDLRFGRIVPVIAGILFNGATWLLICAVPHPVVYTVSVLLNNISYFFTLPYLLGTAAALDREGRWASIACKRSCQARIQYNGMM